MSKLSLTQSNITKIPTPDTRTNYQDTQVKNLYLRVSPAGGKVFVYKRFFQGKPRWVTLGQFPALAPKEARARALELANDIAHGKTLELNDPRTITLGQTLIDYLNKMKLKANTHDNYKSCIEGTLKDWYHTPLHTINRRMVSNRYTELADRTVSRANNTFRVLRALFNFARAQYRDSADRSLYPDNPVSVLTESRQWRRNTRKKTWVKHLNEWGERIAQCPADVRDYYYVLLLTGLRGETIADLRNDPDTLDAKGELAPYYNAEDRSIIWLNKNNDITEVPVTDLVAQIIEQQTITDGCYFGTVNQSRREKAFAKVGLTHSRNDMRRTFLTVGESLDIQRITLKRLAGHRTHEQDVTTGYIMADIERLRAASEQITKTLSVHFITD